MNDRLYLQASLRSALLTLETGRRPVGGVRLGGGEGVPSLGGENVLQDGILSVANVRRVPAAFFSTMSTGVLRGGDVLINKDGAQTGKVAAYADEFPLAAINEHLFLLRADTRVATPRFLYWALLARPAQQQISRLITGSAQPGLARGFVDKVLIPLLPPSHQAVVTEVLDTVDIAIRRTEQLITKLERMKHGLVHDLLTRGIDENGELRDPARQPEGFTDSPLGELPARWKVVRVANLMQPGRRVTYGIVQPGPFTVDGTPLIRGQDYINGWRPLDTFFRVGQRLHRQYSRSVTITDDVLVTIVGATTGATAIVPTWIEEANITQTTARLAFDKRLMLPGFGRAVLASEIGQRQVQRYVKGSAQPGLNLGDVETFLIPVPPVDEQRAITEVLTSTDTQIESEVRELRKLRLLKNGLMEELLTGRVRVAKLLEGDAV